MSELADKSGPIEDANQQAAGWVLRCDRELSAEEQDAFSSWLAANPGHGALYARHRMQWKRLDRLAQWRPEHSDQPNPDLLAPPRHRRVRRFVPVSLGFGLAASLAVIFFWQPKAVDPQPVQSVAAVLVETQRTLPDGSIVELNQGAEIVVDFGGPERRVRLVKGEAHFSVAKDHTRPFVVTVQGIDVRAVGTAFNVRLGTAAVEVLVTEGKVQVDSTRPPGKPFDPNRDEAGDALLSPGTPSIFDPQRSSTLGAPLVPLLEARQRVIVSLAPRPQLPQIATLTQGEIERVMAWQHRMLEFTATPLADIVAEFNRRNVVQLRLADPELAAIRMTIAFRSDNIEGFVRLVEHGFGVTIERQGDAEIVLHKTR